MDKVEIERTILDGRVAERHTSFNENGDKIVEIFAEDKRPLHLEKRIVQKHKNIVSEERTEYVKNGEIVEVEVKAVDSGAKMQLREHIGVADHASVADGHYVTKHDVAEAVVAGITTLMDSMEVEALKDRAGHSVQSPTMSALQMTEQHIEEKKETNATTIMIMSMLVMAQLAFAFYVFFM